MTTGETRGDCYGHLVVGGVRFPILGVELRDGRIWLLASREGPFEHPGGPVTIFGEDGRGIGQGSGVLKPKRVETGEMLSLRIDLLFEAIR